MQNQGECENYVLLCENDLAFAFKYTWRSPEFLTGGIHGSQKMDDGRQHAFAHAIKVTQ
jgi:hypothetical protein